MFKSEVDRAGFVQRLRMLIHDKGLTHRAAAKALGVAETQMSRYFLGQIPEPGKLLRIAQWGGCTLEWLLTGQEGSTQPNQKIAPASQVAKSPVTQEPQLASFLNRWEELDSASKHRVITVLALLKDSSLHDQLFLVLDVLPLIAPPAKHRVKLSVVARRLAVPLALFTIACTKHLSLKDRELFWDLFLKKGMMGAGLAFDLENLTRLLNAGVTFRMAIRKVAETHLADVILRHSSGPASENAIKETVNTLLYIASATPRGDLSTIPAWTKEEKEELKRYAFKKLVSATSAATKKREWSRLITDVTQRLLN